MATKRKVTQVYVHAEVFVVGPGGLSTQGALPPPNKTFEYFEMSLVSDGVLVEVKALRNDPKVHKVLIPFANIKSVELEDDEKK